MPKLIDLTGQRFGRLVVLAEAGRDSQQRKLWLCQCDCGNQTVVRGSNLGPGKTVSCGCHRRTMDRHRVTDKSIWKDNPKLYSVWTQMKNRCENPSNVNYKNYGSRGITVCEEWRNDYRAFREWAMCHGYSDGLTIDRIDNDVGYCPENCRWVPHKEQERNRRNNHRVSFRGEVHTLSEWEEITGISQRTIRLRLKAGWSVERALTEPVHKTK